jgi:hypothetical protein
MRRSAILALVLGLLVIPANPAFAAAKGSTEASGETGSANGTVTEVTTYRELSSGRTVTFARSVEATATGPTRLTFELSPDEIAAMFASLDSDRAAPGAGIAACFEGGKTFTHHINAGKITAWYNLRWCGSGGKVTSASNLWCQGTATGAREYNGCSIGGSGVGSSPYRVSGTWNFRIWTPGVPFPISQPLRLTAAHNPSGTYTGTWCLNC